MLNPTHATVECHPDIFKSDSLKVPKLPFLLSLRATNSLATTTRHSLSVLDLFVGVQYCQITRPCLCGKWQIWVIYIYILLSEKVAGGAKVPQPHPLRGPCGVVWTFAGLDYCFLSRKESVQITALFKLASALSCVLFVKINCFHVIKVYPKLLTLSITVKSVAA